MSTAYLGTARGNAWLQEHLTSKTVWLALHVAEPTALGDPSTEVLGGLYVRKRYIASAPSGKAVSNTNNLIYSGMPACIVRWLAIWSAASSGEMIVAIQLDSPQTVTAGAQFLGAPGDVVVQL